MRDLLEIARATGLRGLLHGVNATDAREVLQRFVDALNAPAADDEFVRIERAVATLPPGYSFADAVEHAATERVALVGELMPRGNTFQRGVSSWMDQCFIPSLYSNMTERGDRLLEEVLELLQSHGYDRTRVATLVDYVYSRPVGDPRQEVGGVMVTLAGYCWIAKIDMQAEGDRELARITQPDVMARIRAKQEAKAAIEFDTPLPGNPEQTPAERLRALKTDDAILWGVVHNAGHGRRPAPRWSHVSAATGMGSTASALLCQRFDLDPDETVGSDDEGGDDAN
jgi:hypothetical protein